MDYENDPPRGSLTAINNTLQAILCTSNDVLEMVEEVSGHGYLMPEEVRETLAEIASHIGITRGSDRELIEVLKMQRSEQAETINKLQAQIDRLIAIIARGDAGKEAQHSSSTPNAIQTTQPPTTAGASQAATGPSGGRMVP